METSGFPWFSFPVPYCIIPRKYRCCISKSRTAPYVQKKKRFSPEIVPHVPHAPMLFCLLKHFVQFTNERIIYDESLTRATKSYLIRSMMKSSQPTSRHVCMYIRNTYICLTGLGPSMYRDMPVYLNLAEVRIHLVHITCLYYK